jgi:hypothetical protein
VSLDVARVHAKEIGGKERRFVAARAGADLEDGVAIVQRIARHEHRLDPFVELRDRAFQSRDLTFRFGRELGVINGNELTDTRELVFRLPQARRQLDERRQATMFTTQFGEPPSVLDRPGIGESRFDFAGPLERFVQPIACAQLSFPYFWRKRSTRPAVSTSFCFPVKKGWHWLQMSVWISAWVERVWNVLPHAHLTVAVAYSG